MVNRKDPFSKQNSFKSYILGRKVDITVEHPSVNVKSAMDEVDEDWQHGLSAKVTKPEVKADLSIL